jgi:hypothetical protein
MHIGLKADGYLDAIERCRSAFPDLYFKKSFVIAAGTAPSDDSGGFMRVERMLWSLEAA